MNGTWRQRDAKRHRKAVAAASRRPSCRYARFLRLNKLAVLLPAAFSSAKSLVEFWLGPAEIAEPGGNQVRKLDEYVKIAEAASLLGVSQNTLRKWADEGRIPVFVNAANGYRLFLTEDLEDFLRQTAEPHVEQKRRRKAR